MGTARYIAAAGTLLGHAGLVWLVLSLAAAPAVRVPPRPVEVALLRPPPPVPPRPEAPKPPEPLPVHKTPPKAPAAVAQPSAAPPSVTPPAPAPAPPPVAVARPVDEARPAAIAVEPAPPSAPVAPRVTEAAAAPRDVPRVVAAPATPAPPARTGPRADASWSGNAPPPYPAMARRLGEEGEVRLDVHVSQDGGVTEVKLKKSSGSALLDQTAIETVKKWRFKPATVDGRPVDEWYYNWKWVFKLES